MNRVCITADPHVTYERGPVRSHRLPTPLSFDVIGGYLATADDVANRISLASSSVSYLLLKTCGHRRLIFLKARRRVQKYELYHPQTQGRAVGGKKNGGKSFQEQRLFLKIFRCQF